MKNITLVITLLLSILRLTAQVYQTGTITLTFNDPNRTGGFGTGGGPGRQIQTEIYYPATTAGSNVAAATGSFPVVVFGHGFVMNWNSYDNIYSMLSKRGYIVALPRTEGGFGPSHADFGLDLALVGSKVLQLNVTNTLAPIFVGKVDQKLALSGHSMGGGSSFLAAKSNSLVTCLFNLAAAQTNPTSSQAAKQVTVPTLIIGGQTDCVTPANTNQHKMWDSTAASIKFEVIIKSLTHCDFGNGSNTNCLLGQNSSGCPSTVGNTLATDLYMNFVNPFLDFNLKGICNEGTRFMDSLNLSQVIFSKQQLGALTCSVTSLGSNDFSEQTFIYPNPVKDLLYVKGIGNGIVNIKVISFEGKELVSKDFTNRNEVELITEDLAEGFYFLRVSTSRSVVNYKIVKY